MYILLGFLVIMVAVFLIIIRMMKISEMERENQLMQSYMSSMKEFYAAIQDRIDATRRYRHDLAKHIQTLERMIKEQKKNAGMEIYMEDLKEKYQELQQEVYCMDETVNAILSLKKQQCKEHNIPMDILVAAGDYSMIEEIDKASLLHNLLDNALEANERIPEACPKGIRFCMRCNEHEIHIEVANYISPGEKVSFKTSKEKTDEHGIGTKIIDTLIEKYHGYKSIAMDEENSIFKKEIVLRG